jgi:hypothetical protein
LVQFACNFFLNWNLFPVSARDNRTESGANASKEASWSVLHFAPLAGNFSNLLAKYVMTLVTE